ncbi:MAG: ABC transporter permease, partial [Chloroflexi bacterium]
MLSRLLYGSRISLAVALVDILIVLLIGVPLGLFAGYLGKWFDALIMRAIDILYAFPSLLLIIVVITYLRAVLDLPQAGLLAGVGAVDKLTGGLLGVFVALALVSWLTVARLVRGQVLSLKQKEYIEAARTVGARPRRIMFAHLLPNVMAPIIISATFGIPGAIA